MTRMTQPELIEDATNERILDAIRWEASPDYQRRIPQADQAGIQRVLQNLTEYRPLWNEFEGAFVNKIGQTIARSKSWTNPFAKFKKGLLSAGDTVEEYQVGLLKAHGWEPKADYGEKMLFGRELAEVQTNYHRINRQDMYKITTNEAVLKRAFYKDSGLSTFITNLMEAPVKSDNWDEFLLMTRLFAEYEKLDGFYKVNVPDVGAPTATADDARTMLRRIRELGDTLAYISTKYNAARMPTHANLGELVLFVTPEVRSSIDVNALAAAFNIGSADVPFQIHSMPEEYFGIDGCQAILTTTDFFMVFDTLIENASMFNPASLNTNHFFHHHEIISASRFVPAVMFTTKPGTDVVEVTPKIASITGIKIYDSEGVEVQAVAPGLLYTVKPVFTTTPTDSADWWNHGIRLTLSRAQSPRSYLSDSGVLCLSGIEPSSKVTVTAFDINDEAVTIAAEVPVTGKRLPSWPAN